MNRKLITPNQTKNAIFFTEGDVVIQHFVSTNRSLLERKLKIAALMSEFVVIPVSHIFESRLTFEILRETPELLIKNIVVPSMPSQFSEISDYIKERFAPFAQTKTEQRSLFTRYEFLEHNTTTLLLRNDSKMRQFYKQSLLRDLNDRNSLLYRSLDLSDAEILGLISQISATEPMSRESAFKLADRLDEHRKRVFILYLQTLYCVTGSIGNNSDPLLNPILLPFMQDKATRASKGHDPRLFSKVLETIGIAQSVLDQIPLSEIPNLSRETAVRRFREKYHTLIDKARKGLIQAIGEEFQPEVLQDILIDLVRSELRREKSTLRLKKIWAFSSFATALISSVVTLATGSPLASTLSGLSSLVGILDIVFDLSDPLVSKILDTKTEFVVFSSTLLDKAKPE